MLFLVFVVNLNHRTVLRSLYDVASPVLEVLLNDWIAVIHANEPLGTADCILGITMRLVDGALPNQVAIIFEGYL